MKRPKLYWVSDPWNDEDWFVVSDSKRNAERFYENYEGMSRGAATAKLIGLFPQELIGSKRTHYPLNTDLEKYGAQFFENGFSTMVLIHNRPYIEGSAVKDDRPFSERCVWRRIGEYSSAEIEITKRPDVQLRLLKTTDLFQSDA